VSLQLPVVGLCHEEISSRTHTISFFGTATCHYDLKLSFQRSNVMWAFAYLLLEKKRMRKTSITKKQQQDGMGKKKCLGVY
jgi:hypothetical protein